MASCTCKAVGESRGGAIEGLCRMGPGRFLPGSGRCNRRYGALPGSSVRSVVEVYGPVTHPEHRRRHGCHPYLNPGKRREAAKVLVLGSALVLSLPFQSLEWSAESNRFWKKSSALEESSSQSHRTSDTKKPLMQRMLP